MISDANTGRLHGKVVIVTGAGGSLGSASAQLFAAQEASIVCADRDLDAAQKTADTIREHGGAAVPLDDMRQEEAGRRRGPAWSF